MIFRSPVVNRAGRGSTTGTRSAMEMDKIYLDTNILIEGSKRPEHEKLVKLSKQGKLILYFSIKNEVEMYKKAEILREKWSSISTINSDYFIFKRAMQDYENAAKSEEVEWKFWDQAKLRRSISTFNSLMANGTFAAYLDRKNELLLWEQLIIHYKIKQDDTVHLMHAHSAGLNYVLTWDREFIKKSKRVKWLKCIVCTPNDYLDKI